MQTEPLANRPRILEFMRHATVDALVASAPHNVRYLTGYHNAFDVSMREWMSRPGGSDHPAGAGLAIYSLEHGPGLVIGPGFACDAAGTAVEDLRIIGALTAERSPGRERLAPELEQVHDARRYPSGNELRAVADVLIERGLGAARIGIDRTHLAPGAREALAQLIPRAQLLDCHNTLRLIRMVKSPAEIALLRRVAEINERAAVDATSTLTAGDSSGSLACRYGVAVSEAGALADHATPTVLGVGFTSSPAHVFRAGETFAFDVGCSLGGYYADAQFTVSVAGPLDPALAERHDLLRRCVLEVGVDAARTGTRASTVHDAMTSFLSSHGASAFPTGHGLGLEYRDYPIIVPDTGLRIADECVDREADLPLETGMVLNIEATTFLTGHAAVGCEVTCLVTDAGPVVLSPQDRSRPLGGGA